MAPSLLSSPPLSRQLALASSKPVPDKQREERLEEGVRCWQTPTRAKQKRAFLQFLICPSLCCLQIRIHMFLGLPDPDP
jgi:hypothetical protein